VAAVTAVYPPPLPGLPYLAVVILGGAVDVTPFPTLVDAEAYLEVCNVGLGADARREKGMLDA
jgi:hypothetical protein